MKTPGPWPRRAPCLVAATAAFLALASLSPRAAASEPAGPLDRLRAGNGRFVKGAAPVVPLVPATRPGPTSDQHPFAMVLSCADSRVPPEFIFNASLGDLFVVRAAGEVVDKSVLATLEFGVAHLHIPLLVVMGHESCDVVQAATGAEQLEGPNLDYLATHILAGVRHGAADRKDLRSAILANVEQVINDAMGSSILRAATSSGQLQVVGAYYELGSGHVVFSEPIGAMPTVHE